MPHSGPLREPVHGPLSNRPSKSSHRKDNHHKPVAPSDMPNGHCRVVRWIVPGARTALPIRRCSKPTVCLVVRAPGAGVLSMNAGLDRQEVLDDLARPPLSYEVPRRFAGEAAYRPLEEPDGGRPIVARPHLGSHRQDAHDRLQRRLRPWGRGVRFSCLREMPASSASSSRVKSSSRARCLGTSKASPEAERHLHPRGPAWLLLRRSVEAVCPPRRGHSKGGDPMPSGEVFRSAA